ncbi:MAG: GTPase [Phycisphaerae bacterium]
MNAQAQIITPPPGSGAPGAVGVIQLTGPAARQMIARLARWRGSQIAPGQIVRAKLSLVTVENAEPKPQILLTDPKGCHAQWGRGPAGHDSRQDVSEPSPPLESQTPTEIIDDGLVLCLHEQHWELHVHGGSAVLTRLLQVLADAGATILPTVPHQVVAPGGSLGLPGSDGLHYSDIPPMPSPGLPPGATNTRHRRAPEPWAGPIGREVLATLPHAQTRTTVRLLAGQAAGGLTAWAHHWQTLLNTALASSYSPADAARLLMRFQSAAQWLLDRSGALDRLLTPPRIVLVGPPNAGKSTLINALLGRAISITSPLAGTTRDWVDAQAVLAAGSDTAGRNGTGKVEVAVTMIDTAGVRTSADPIEQIAVERTWEQVRQADLVLAVLDATALLPSAAYDWLEPLFATAQAVQIVINKIDAIPAPDHRAAFPWGRPVSAVRQTGLDELVADILKTLGLGAVEDGATMAEPWAFTARQRVLLNDAALGSTLAPIQAALTELAG